ncbi:MAG: DUF2911 domain-containing protein [Cyclobacteriaceae bacterium]
MRTLVVFFLFVAGFASAQSPVLYTRPSQMAKVLQRIGTTDIEVVYHSPLAKGRKIFGDIVPYNEKVNGVEWPWRAGANENTTISFTHDVEINGNPLKAGTYGLHIFVSEKEWTLAFSNQYQAWGNFNYQAEEDALRVKVTPGTAEMQDWLSYDFSNPEPESVTLSLRWEQTKASFKISTNVDRNILADLNKIEAKKANHLYMMASLTLKLDSTDTNDAMMLVDESLALERSLGNSLLKADLLRLTGKKTEAEQVKKAAISASTANELFTYAMKLDGESKSGVMELLKLNQSRHPEDWFSYMGYANYYMTREDYKNAVAYFEKTLEYAPARGAGFARYRLGFAKNKLLEASARNKR